MPLDIPPKQGRRWDLVALGEVMLRFDPGDGRLHTTREFRVSEGGGEYNVARGLKRCFGLDTALIRRGSIGDHVPGAPRPKDTSLNTSKAASLLGSPPTVLSGIERMHEQGPDYRRRLVTARQGAGMRGAKA